MKIYKPLPGLFFHPILKKVTFFSKTAGLFVLLNFAVSTCLFARKDSGHDFKEQGKQAITVTGRVSDENDNPLAGVTVQVKNLFVTATTNEAGNFSIAVPDKSAVLVFTYVGYDEQEAAAGTNRLDIHLKASGTNLGEVVVVGYGTQRRVSVTGAVDRIGSAAIEGRPVANVAQALQGTSPGIVIQQRTFQPVSGALNINIRGLGTTNDNNPLIVIDGIIGGDLNLINPNDIDNISVLKMRVLQLSMVPVQPTAL